ncbi:related to het-6-heterokaryon incompatibility protein [Fusarium fujikuroi]|nr:related to het-6-heterokaryon incompatibility protein [Fusarium fujikuroi]SCN69183.1 related to het-6-heterokaryon incompatibility protein [Fusarium fujikuroi]SCN90567.1 related to het-6-heterokaryon incompatibility protein [Fusarium fujikuroi]SCV26602.1 related to het-6-heterokaryon incompatibility protein [Fusarium fujikuroi]
MATMIAGLYRPLSPTQIRLIRLNPNIEDPVCGHLVETELADAPPYHAISHAWVPGISVKATPEINRVHLSDHLATCIRRLQKFATENLELSPMVAHIWLDSICINQDDVHERALQVAMMGSIYRQSIRTLIWLGEESSPSIHLAWQLINDIYAIFQKQNPLARSLSDIATRTYDDKLHTTAGLPPFHTAKWVHLKHLMDLRWFSRMWIVQEVVLSRGDPIFLHGDCHYAWEPLGWAVGWLRRSGYLRLPQVPEQLRNVDTISNLRRARTRWPLDALMSITQVKFHATDQRDKVYGVLGLALECEDGSGLPEELKPDYTIDVATLYQRVARFLLKKNRSLASLTRARCVDGSETRKQRVHDIDLPSWCPDWSDFNTYNEGISTSLSWIEYSNILKPARLGFPGQYRAAGGSEVSFGSLKPDSEESTLLQLNGFIVDQVDHVHQFDFGSLGHGQALAQFDSAMAPIVRIALTLIPATDTLGWMGQFIQTTTARQYYLNGKDLDQSTSDGAAWLHGFFQRRDDVASLLDKQPGKDELMSQIQEASTDGAKEDYIALVQNFCFDRAFIITGCGRIGIGPSSTCPEDKVSVIFGGDVPYIIRGTGDYLNLVGESYIHGLMEAQTIDKYKTGLIQKEVFCFK